MPRGKLANATSEESCSVVAVGTSGEWVISVLQGRAKPDLLFLEIESPFVYLYFPITSNTGIDRLIDFLGEASAEELWLGKPENTELLLVRDDEFDDRFFFKMTTASAVTLHLTVVDPHLTHLRESLQKASRELAAV